ncbi:hypothetical protein BBP00_00007719 [Phytophthora kernoviae]|uniref:SRCR domain-containing protein n=1 Tax=Phytophthora kernoviae TaxID=325452 RepID=A0A3F2RHF9_9STRA|nr:hypothetical protein BBP00_00007719 [Phytophthora kernoviae]
MMRAKTLALVALLVTVIGHANADQAAHLRVRVHAKDAASCADGEESIAVLGWGQEGCVKSDNESIAVLGWGQEGCVKSDNVCAASTEGDCPTGAHCEKQDSGEYGCEDGDETTTKKQKKEHHHHKKSHTKDAATCDDSEESIAVLGWGQEGCVKSGNVCAASTEGDCPTGTHCEKQDSGEYGCEDGDGTTAKKQKKHHHHKKSHTKDAASCADGEESIAVLGWGQEGCVKSDNVCAASTEGDCPTGAHCEKQDSGEYGCEDGDGTTAKKQKKHHHHKKSHTKDAASCADGEESIAVLGWGQEGCVKSDNVCAASTEGDCPTGAHCEKQDSGEYGCEDGTSS